LTNNGSNLAASSSFKIVLATATPSLGPGGDLLPEEKVVEIASPMRPVDLVRYKDSSFEMDRRTRTLSGLPVKACDC
jgi:hypothetical protein